MRSWPRFFIAGTIQGSLQGVRTISQEYRSSLRALIIKQYPNVGLYCPEEILRNRLGLQEREIRESFVALSSAEVIRADAYNHPIRAVAQVFQELVRMAGEADVLVAYLPDHQASMGTAMEMWSAFENRKIVVTISNMRQNLAVVSTSTIIVPDIAAFERLLTNRWLDQEFEARQVRAE